MVDWTLWMYREIAYLVWRKSWRKLLFAFIFDTIFHLVWEVSKILVGNQLMYNTLYSRSWTFCRKLVHHSGEKTDRIHKNLIADLMWSTVFAPNDILVHSSLQNLNCVFYCSFRLALLRQTITFFPSLFPICFQERPLWGIRTKLILC